MSHLYGLNDLVVVYLLQARPTTFTQTRSSDKNGLSVRQDIKATTITCAASQDSSQFEHIFSLTRVLTLDSTESE